MARPINILVAKQVQTLPPGRHGDGGGLYLLVRDSGSRFWLFRYKVDGKMREMGLGPASGSGAVTLADARAKAADLMKQVRAKVDPLEARAREAAAKQAEAKAALIRGKTFEQVAKAYIASKEAGWRNDKHRAQWGSTLETYAYPTIGEMPVADIEADHVEAILKPIWTTKPETASRVRGRIEMVLDYAHALKWRVGENPARWRGHMANLLPARGKVARVQHHSALPWAEMGDFMAELRKREASSARALEFAILTAARSGEVFGARWCELDLVNKLWTVPGERMKAGRDHKVPLSPAALAVVQAMAIVRPKDDNKGQAFVFPGAKAGSPLSGMSMIVLLRRMNPATETRPARWRDPASGEPVTPHGFRSTFRDWVAESTSFAGEIAEAALAHVVGDKVEAAYRRGDLFEKRRKLMEAWAEHCAAVVKPASAKVTPIRRKVAG